MDNSSRQAQQHSSGAVAVHDVRHMVGQAVERAAEQLASLSVAAPASTTSTTSTTNNSHSHITSAGYQGSPLSSSSALPQSHSHSPHRPHQPRQVHHRHRSHPHHHQQQLPRQSAPAALSPLAPAKQLLEGRSLAARARRKRELHTPKRQQHNYSTAHLISGADTHQEDINMKEALMDAERQQRERQGEMKKYFVTHNLFTKFEAMVTCIAVDRPENHKQQLLAMLRRLRDFDGVVTWDMFVPPHKRPPHRPLPYWMTRGDEDDDRPTPEMYQKAYAFNTKRILGPVVKSWVEWYKMRLRLKAELYRRLDMALEHYHRSLLKRYIKPWVQFKNDMQEKRRQVITRMRGRRKDNLVRVVFSAWREYAAQSKLASQYFKNISKTQEQPRDTLAQETDHFSALPYDIRVKILSHVGILDRMRCAMVCRTWREVAQDASLWGSVLFSELGASCSDEAVSQIVDKYKTFICKVNMRGCSSVTNVGFSQLGQCHNLQDLNLSDCCILRDAAIKAIVEGCPALIYLNLACCGITDLSLKYLSKHCVNLSYLSLACCENITDAGCMYLTEGSGCQSLFWLDLSCCPQLGDVGLASIGAKCTNLSTVLLNDLSRMTDAGLGDLVQSCPYITQLSLRACPQVTDEGLTMIGKHCTCLSHIELTANARVTSEGITGLCLRTKLSHVVINDCPRVRDGATVGLAQQHLSYLDLSECAGLTDSALKTIAQSGPARSSLQVVKLSSLPRITDTGIRHFGRGVANAYHLDLSYCTNVTDGSLGVLITHTGRLSELNLAGCDNVGDGTLQALQASDITTLEWLDLTECTALTDQGLEALAFSSPLLRHLCLAGCTSISDDAFKELAYGCQRLEWLSIAYCDQLTDRSLQLIGTGCKKLRTLHLFGLPNITNSAFEHVLSTCKSLRTVSVSSSSQISRSVIARARVSYPHLRIHYDMDEPMFDSQMPLRTFYAPEILEEFE
ncbi:hypothetical protein PTSG_03789 [Salpingoeca rosetta]|uniref:F-box domain-containing protein n=1 Tax=Salpingoeca rosetta (strain ATCC 50818 / BSB-021) TaxID=946362 RepID=F2U5E2_SALR5|nr:uncharacterized protein PTSG_03789 [Salpingoeca rosetta]EGD83158.1 hypothetical protein PTSG_03789 [Salpingoeca rosetta]|eukprot:XP_004995522.1 hypothetical protein PTSG_03789 [Salpingoeca rosetta]